MSLKTVGKSILALSLLGLPNLAHAQFVASNTSLWFPLSNGGNGIWDPANDQQTGQPEGDFVGVAGSIPSSYIGFYNPTASPNTDGTLFFRSRHSGDSAGGNQTPTYNGLVWVGIDANADNRIDIFVGANRQGSNTQLEIRNPGTGANNAPSTTSITNSTLWTAPMTATNYNYTVVSGTNYNGLDFDADNEDGNDYFQSFAIPFQEIVNNLNTVGVGRPTPIAITDQTNLRYTYMTATQSNSINQDFNGAVGDTYGYNDPNPPTTFLVVPEPSTLAFLLPGLFFLRRRRK